MVFSNISLERSVEAANRCYHRRHATIAYPAIYLPQSIRDPSTFDTFLLVFVRTRSAASAALNPCKYGIALAAPHCGSPSAYHSSSFTPPAASYHIFCAYIIASAVCLPASSPSHQFWPIANPVSIIEFACMSSFFPLCKGIVASLQSD